MKRMLVLQSYQPAWASLFESEAVILRRIWGSECLEIHHIGSTSISTVPLAKPIIDLLAVVKDVSFMDLFEEDLSYAGYTSKGENGISGRAYFVKGGFHRTHHLHVFEQGHPHILQHLAFKQYLLAHPREAERYGRWKQEWMEQHGDDANAYAADKQKVTDPILRRALLWADQTGGRPYA
ncbi:GrpB family protein [Marinicrinis sediminis]|uniref:GrpB family protein n=1 Tax=Marinicrinis sediminis TaxID=1652465 RepID=A0ABW5REI3_9BACL